LATTVLGDDVLKLHSLNGHEALSEPFQFTVTLVSRDDKSVVDLAVLLGTVVHVTVDQENTAVQGVSHPERYFNGYVSEVSREVLPSARWLYTVELRPWLWLLGKTKNCRIFQNMSVPDIVEKVFTDAGFNDFERRLNKTYEKREYCVPPTKPSRAAPRSFQTPRARRLAGGSTTGARRKGCAPRSMS
jgi:type VI secretion system secreted protein VgrG